MKRVISSCILFCIFAAAMQAFAGSCPSAPKVSSYSPTGYNKSVTSVKVVFSGTAIDTTTVISNGTSSDTFYVTDSSGIKHAGTLSTNSSQITINYSSSLPNDTYTVTVVSGGIKSSSSNCSLGFVQPNGSAYPGSVLTWTFTVDNVAPYVTGVTANGVTLINTPYITTQNPTITVNFSEQVMGLTTSTILLKSGSNTITEKNFSPSGGQGASASFQPNSSLTNGTTYQVTFGSGLTDLSGNALTTPSTTYNFIVDSQAPVINAISPTPGSTGISTAAAITVSFTENIAMNKNSFNPSNIVLTDSSGSVITTSINYGSSPYTTLTITPANTLAFNTQYTLTLNNITDVAGNPLASSGSYTVTAGTYTMNFTTQAASEATYSIIPPYLSAPIMPNVLIILDNSNSMDEDMDGNAIGSYNCTNTSDPNSCSRSVLARTTLANIINTYANKMNIGLMTYNLPSVAKDQLHNNFYFASYDPHNYCPNPVTSSDGINHCYNYCLNEDPKTGSYTPSTDEAACSSTCQSQNPLFKANYWPFGTTGTASRQWPGREPILTTNGTSTTSANGTAIGSSKRAAYCALVYPKISAYVDPTTGTTVYHGLPGTLYDSNNDGTQFAYSSGYDSRDTVTSYYNTYSSFLGTSDGANGYSGQIWSNAGFTPTDDDKALGFYNFGQRNYWYWTSQTYFANTPANPAGGYLHVPVSANDSTNAQLTSLLTQLGIGGSTAWLPPVKPYNDMTDYMACSSTSNPNQCPFIVNAGWTPTEGTLMSAVSYFNSKSGAQFSQGGTTYATPIQYRCQKNFIIYVTDGLPSTTASGSSKDSNGNPYTASTLLPAVLTQLNTLRCPTNPVTPNCTVQQAFSGTTYKFDVKTFVLGMAISPQSQSLLDQMAVAGGADNGGHAYYANDATSLNNSLVSIFQNILLQMSSGTATSILNNSQGSGANILQGVFYPQKSFDSNTQVNWIGEIQDLWYYLDPYFATSTVREDTNRDYVLSLKDDNIATFRFDTSSNKTVMDLTQDVNGDQSNLASQGTSLSPDVLKSLWKAGQSLWGRNIGDSSQASYDPRNIYTILAPAPTTTSPITGASGVSLTPFTNANLSTNTLAQTCLQTSTQAAAGTLINYVTGVDQSGYRGRKVTQQSCGLTDAEGCTREWKLGDVVNSTPKLVSNINLNTYGLIPPYGYNDNSYNTFVNSNNYRNRGVAFAGGNDGMIHAFRLGVLDVSPQTSTTSGGQTYIDPYKKARMMYPNGTTASYATSNLGREEWAFIPMNVLPYLKYLGDPNYSHIFFVDGTPTPIDASINAPANNDNINYPGCSTDYSKCQKKTTLDGSNNLDMNNTSWRTILIGGMGLGGATRNASTETCIDGSPSGTCVKTPVNGVGYSSYFALDVTNPATLPPASGAVKFLWEFNAQGQLGYTMSGPAVVRIGQPGLNGRWLAVFGSGPTGPIDTTTHIFYGKSDQNLKLFVVDIGTGQLMATIDTGIQNAFAGNLTTAVIDTDRDNAGLTGFYSDDAIYVGYVQQDSATGTWTKGGVLRVYTSPSRTGNQAADIAYNQDPTHWQVFPLIQNIGPVTTAVAKLQDRNAVYGGSGGSSATGKLWVYFGSGRYFYNSDMMTPSTPFRLYGIMDPCYSHNTGSPSFAALGPSNVFDTSTASSSSCSTQVIETQLHDQTGSISSGPAASLNASDQGWFVSLAGSETYNGTNFNAERVISNPLASPSGTVFFNTFLPTADLCGFGGESYIWALNYKNGAAPMPATMQGNILMQLSSGVLQQVSLQSAFGNQSNLGYNNRRMNDPATGATQGGITGTLNPRPARKVLHIQEK